MTTTSYGTWLNLTGDSLTVSQSVYDSLNGHDGDVEKDFDLAAIEQDYRAEIAKLLPQGVQLVGDEFYGPVVDGPDWSLADLRAQIDGPDKKIDFWAIVQRHDRTA